MSKGLTKHDEEKVMLDLIDPRFTEELGKLLTAGAKKYAPDNWKKITRKDKRRILGALHRHINKYQQGETHDEEGLDHLMCATCNLMFLRFLDEKIKTPKKVAEKKQ